MIYGEENFPELPSSWETILVDLACENISVREKIQTKHYKQIGRLPIIDQGAGLVGGYTDDMSKSVADKLPVVVFGDHTRAIKFIDFQFAAGADGIKVLAPNEFFVPKLLFRFLQAVKLPDKGYARHFQHLRASYIAVPPLNEQKRIADKLDALLARVHTCRARLDRVPLIIKRFRQSVLAAATSGKLTEDWRQKSGRSFEWSRSTLGLVGDVTGGITKNAGRVNTSLIRKYLRVANVYANRFVLDDISHIGTTPEEFSRTRLRPGDVLIVEGNGSIEQIGRAALWRGEIEDCAHQNHLIRWRTRGMVVPEFALYWLLSPSGRGSLVEFAKSSAGLHTLNLSKVSAVPVEIPTLAEQTEIVRRVETLFAYADRLAARYTAARAQVEKLTPALLAKAFRGELVPQDPNDEPASVLLQRIRAARVAEPERKKPGRKSVPESTGV